MRRVKGICFDKDGVLVDFAGCWGPATADVIVAVSKGDAQVASALAESIDFDLQRAEFAPSSIFIAGAGTELIRLWSQIIPLNGDAALRIFSMFSEAGQRHVAPTPYLKATLDALRAEGLSLGIATNDQEDSARMQMQTLGVVDAFSLISGADSGHGPKPGPGMILAFADAIDAEPERVLMIGDTTHDIDAARAAGAIAVAVGTGPAPLAELAPLADHAIKTLADLPGLVSSL